ncbi:TerB family tellurite resistance protein [Geopsychrobacter electrodiphilus]|uniref:tellurite resistance TerB family protein n=1 Tax=Geopsychrobacter electrodiphilus TaxID=225196 RepID=UPI000367DDF4|nr:TerB family tellurite resistance protein [Geopsychrobacter electrodiphilus]
MLKKIFSLFTSSEEISQPDRISLAAAVLLLEVAYADGECSNSEEELIRNLLQQRFNLAGEKLDELLTLATETQQQSVDLYQFTSQINRNFSQPEKEQIIEAFWHLAFADGRLDVYEETLLRQLGSLIGLSDRQLIDAKIKVRSELDSGN